MSFEKELLSKIPIWVQFYNVPLEFWSAEGLSYVASAIGNPLFADSMTENCSRLSYARICVEVDVDAQLPSKVLPRTERNRRPLGRPVLKDLLGILKRLGLSS